MRFTLKVTGRVARPIQLEWQELAATVGALDETAAADLDISGAAVPVASLLERADPLPEATHGTVVGGDSNYTASIPLEDLLVGGWLAYRLGNDPLPAQQGGPLRLIVLQGSTLCWNVKDVTEIRLTAGKEPDSIPENPSH